MQDVEKHPSVGKREHSDNVMRRGSRWLRRKLLYAALVSICWIVWLIPAPFWHVLVIFAGYVGMALPTRRIVLENVRQVRGPSSPMTAFNLGRRQIATHIRNVIGMFRAGARLPDKTNKLDVEHMENLAPYLGKRGIVLVAPHAGPYPVMGLLAARMLKEHGYAGEIAVVARLFRPIRSGVVREWFIRRYGEAGVEIVVFDDGSLRMASRLRTILANNGVVVLLVDEPTDAISQAVPFFSSAIKLPVGPVRLAHLTRSVIVPMLTAYRRAGRMSILIEPGIEPVADPDVTLNQLAGSLERLIDRELPQWSMLSPIWHHTPVPGAVQSDRIPVSG
jgi:lauroyl/myristoyl acyltransferase